MHYNPLPIFVCFFNPSHCTVAWGGTQAQNFSSNWFTFQKKITFEMRIHGLLVILGLAAASGMGQAKGPTTSSAGMSCPLDGGWI